MSLENLALDVAQQSSFDASIKNLRKVLEDGDEKAVRRFKGPDRGVVFLNRIPFGFFENEIMKYFQQFGKVTRVRVARSRKTGNSKGFAYIEFKYPEVAKVAAETMNNYLMFNKILQAKYIPPEEQKYDYFRGVVQGKVPKDRHRKKHIELFNRSLNATEKKLYCKRASYKLMQKLKKLQALGIEYECKSVIKFRTKDLKKHILTIDESDEEITFKIPQNVAIVRRKAASTGNKSITSKKKNPAKKGLSNDSVGGFSVIESNTISSKTQKGNQRREETDDLQDDANKSDILREDKSQNALKSKAIRRKSDFTEARSVESPNLKGTTKNCKAKSVKSVSSAWKVDDCS
ncbi:hypothetical protein J437_LFUL006723 [Ladona fulva]|uniref:RRM domain-containing protein n=1 Tax=Ladona fulva TaxID=123851 RepID=A0A8K0JTD5_LADFU|nr:hypothetical protein J437_LFUL006723 [Ladona fulva]